MRRRRRRLEGQEIQVAAASPGRFWHVLLVRRSRGALIKNTCFGATAAAAGENWWRQRCGQKGSYVCVCARACACVCVCEHSLARTIDAVCVHTCVEPKALSRALTHEQTLTGIYPLNLYIALGSVQLLSLKTAATAGR